MQHYDRNNNAIERTLYDSFLSKLIIENEKYYRPVFDKITHAMMEVLNKLQEDIKKYDKLIGHFIVVHIWSEALFDESEHNQYVRNVNLVERFFYFRKKASICKLVNFIKFFFEDYLTLDIVDAIWLSKRNEKNASLSLTELCQKKLAQAYKSVNDLQVALRPEELFAEANRGRIEIKNPEVKSTPDLGIMALASTHPRLKNYFNPDTDVGNAKLYFKKNYRANFTKLLDWNDIPYISGPSGTIVNSLAGIFALIPLAPAELRQFAMGLSGALVAKGHHSFFECMVVLKVTGFTVEVNDYKKFIEQILTDEFKVSATYQHFLKNFDAEKLIHEMELDRAFELLPHVSIFAEKYQAETVEKNEQKRRAIQYL